MAWPDGTWKRIEHRERSKLAVQAVSGDYLCVIKYERLSLDGGAQATGCRECLTEDGAPQTD